MKRSLWLLVLLVAITFTMRWALSRNKAQRLFDLPSPNEYRFVGVRGENAFFIGNSPSPRSPIQSRSVNGKETRTLGEVEGIQDAYSMVMTEDALYFKVAPPGEMLTLGFGGPVQAGVMSVSTGRGAGMQGRRGDQETAQALSGISVRTQRAGNSGRTPPLTPPTLPRNKTPWPLEGAGDPPGASNIMTQRPSRVGLYRVPLSGGPRQEVKAPLPRNPFGQRDYAVLGDKLYFTRYVPDPPVPTSAPVPRRKNNAVELLSCPLAGGKATLVKRVPGILSMLYGGRTRLFWIVARPEDPTRVDLYHMAAGESDLKIVRDYESWFPGVVAGERLYWVTRRFMRRNPKAAAVTLETSNLMTAGLNGEDRHIVEPVIESGENRIFLGRPLTYNDRVYVQVSERTGDPDGMNRKEVLHRVRADLNGLERVVNLPSNASERGAFVDGAWYYFAVVEHRQGLLDLLRDGDKSEYVEVLHRLRLPQ